MEGKYYEEYPYPKEFIGASDIAALILVGIKKEKSEYGLHTQILDFGIDGGYSAYIVDKDAVIGSRYSLVGEFTNWLKIYDDTSFVYLFEGREIKVYRAGDADCIIQIID